MKKSLLALAVLGAFAGVASAQSSVVLYGTVDLNGRIVKNDDQKRKLTESQDGINSSQLGFRAVEDLGGGLKAGFNLLAGINADTGTTNTAQPANTTVGAAPAVNPNGTTGGTAPQNKFFNRRSTVSLFSNAGELRLGRDYVPTFWNTTIFDAFGTNGIGASTNVARYSQTRSDNAIQYFLPANIGGFYGQFMGAASEKTAPNGNNSTNLDKPGRYIGGRVGFAAGPFDVAVAGSQVKFGNVSTLGILNGDKVTQINVGGSFDFGFLKLLGYVDRNKLENAKEMIYSASVVVPIGQSEIHAGADLSNFNPDGGGNTTKVVQFKATYQYNLSKRTAMYATASYLDNKDDSAVVLPGGYGVPNLGGKSKGAEFGVRHFF